MMNATTETLDDLVRRKKLKDVGVQVKMPKALKDDLKTFCDKKEISLKDFINFSVKQTLRQYQGQGQAQADA